MPNSTTANINCAFEDIWSSRQIPERREILVCMEVFIFQWLTRLSKGFSYLSIPFSSYKKLSESPNNIAMAVILSCRKEKPDPKV